MRGRRARAWLWAQRRFEIGNGAIALVGAEESGASRLHRENSVGENPDNRVDKGFSWKTPARGFRHPLMEDLNRKGTEPALLRATGLVEKPLDTAEAADRSDLLRCRRARRQSFDLYRTYGFLDSLVAEVTEIAARSCSGAPGTVRNIEAGLRSYSIRSHVPVLRPNHRRPPS